VILTGVLEALNANEVKSEMSKRIEKALKN